MSAGAGAGIAHPGFGAPAAPPPPQPPGGGDAGMDALGELLARWRRLDRLRHFWHPVTEEQAPGYHRFIASPMSFDRMEQKVRRARRRRPGLLRARCVRCAPRRARRPPSDTLRRTLGVCLRLSGGQLRTGAGRCMRPFQARRLRRAAGCSAGSALPSMRRARKAPGYLHCCALACD